MKKIKKNITASALDVKSEDVAKIETFLAETIEVQTAKISYLDARIASSFADDSVKAEAKRIKAFIVKALSSPLIAKAVKAVVNGVDIERVILLIKNSLVVPPKNKDYTDIRNIHPMERGISYFEGRESRGTDHICFSCVHFRTNHTLIVANTQHRTCLNGQDLYYWSASSRCIESCHIDHCTGYENNQVVKAYIGEFILRNKALNVLDEDFPLETMDFFEYLTSEDTNLDSDGEEIPF